LRVLRDAQKKKKSNDFNFFCGFYGMLKRERHELILISFAGFAGCSKEKDMN
jgi:hypothetical protein